MGGQGPYIPRAVLETQRLAFETQRLAFESERRAFEIERRAFGTERAVVADFVVRVADTPQTSGLDGRA